MGSFFRLRRSLLRHWRAYFARPDMLTDVHAEQLVWLTREVMREAIREGRIGR